MGKNYANRKVQKERPESDFYPTPKSLVWKLADLGIFDPHKKTVDPACGEGAILDALKEKEFKDVEGFDIKTGKDFLTSTETYPQGVMNPPFSLFDEFIFKAKETFPIFASIMKTNFFGAYGRNQKGIWKNLKTVYIFDRMVDYRSPTRDDGLFHVGVLVTAWGIWDRSWNKDYWETKILSVQEYAKLGGIKE